MFQALGSFYIVGIIDLMIVGVEFYLVLYGKYKDRPSSLERFEETDY